MGKIVKRVACSVMSLLMLISMNISLLVQAKDEFKKQALKNGVYVIQSMVSNNGKVLDISKADTKSYNMGF